MEKNFTVDIVTPAYNEDETLIAFFESLFSTIDILPHAFNIYVVDDGSDDQTNQVLTEIAKDQPQLTILTLSRNFGHQAALTAGLDHAQSEIVITMDCDGQHPPDLIPEMLKLHQENYDIVFTQRTVGQKSSWLKRRTSAIFYKLLNLASGTRILPGSADFRSMTRQVALELREMREYHRFLRGMLAWVGFNSAVISYDEPERFAGESKYTIRKMIRLALDAAFSFSLVPLYFGLIVGIVFLILAGIEAIYVLSLWVGGHSSSLAPGWSSLMFVILFMGGCLFIMLSLIGIYVGLIFQEVKRRPVYLIKNISTGESES